MDSNSRRTSNGIRHPDSIAVLLSVFLAGCSGVKATRSSAPPAGGSNTLPARQIIFYEVPLVCPAAPQIGCGSASKPVLLELEGTEGVLEAWLNRAGSIIAVVCEPASNRLKRRVGGVLKRHDLPPKEINAPVKRELMREFQAGSNWYRGAEVDRLSEEEAGIMAVKWVGKIRQQMSVSEEKAKAIQDGFTVVLRAMLLGQSSRTEAHDQMVAVCKKHLTEQEVARLLEALKDEVRER